MIVTTDRIDILDLHFRDENGRDVVLTNDGAPLTDVNQLGKDKRAATAGRAISTREFKQAVQSRAGHTLP